MEGTRDTEHDGAVSGESPQDATSRGNISPLDHHSPDYMEVTITIDQDQPLDQRDTKPSPAEHEPTVETEHSLDANGPLTPNDSSFEDHPSGCKREALNDQVTHANSNPETTERLPTTLQVASVIPLVLDVDSQEDTDADSGIGNPSRVTSTASLRTSVYQFIEENGRRYHKFKEGKYLLPNDEEEQDRLDLQHHLFLLTLEGKLHLAPIENLEGGLHNVLDIATGTGIWAIDFANQFPSASVIGTDLSPIQPAFVPPNCRFEVDDAEDEWLYSHPFDYIHARAVTSCFRSHLAVIKSCFAALRPGGYLELQDGFLPVGCVDDSLQGTALQRWDGLIAAGARALGKDWHRVPLYKQYLQEVGFVDVVEVRFAWPMGTWARGERMKTLGMWAREDFLAVLQGLSMAVLTRGLAMTAEEVEVLLVDVRREVMSRRVHSYAPIYVVYGRKPMDAV